MRRVVLATGNRHKLREIGALLAPSGIELVAQDSLGVLPAEETGSSFVENALLKARHASALSGLPAIADDSGIEVEALNGRPGVQSARFAGPGATDEDNLRKLEQALAGVPDDRRGARYVCAMVYVRTGLDPTPVICERPWMGRIARERRGSNGFGYDPVFLVPSLGLTAAQLDPERKNELSHRGQALRALLTALPGAY
ncbi:MAG TPA: RdgB/HAM1 family non-canonical purine NTP pyrophosphatase [Steroidobacteraceae bacterium]|nr:RdgB/HAM1 family non-canonical purine NTP pyrophosphatase [Steroidobacteraceae bacterium]